MRLRVGTVRAAAIAAAAALCLPATATVVSGIASSLHDDFEHPGANNAGLAIDRACRAPPVAW